MVAKYTLRERIERMKELRKQGYICSQCVAMVFDDVHGLSQEITERLTAGFGGGIGGSGEVCGAVSAMVMLDGCVNYSTPTEKQKLYSHVRDLCHKFKNSNGSLLCRDLRVPGKKTCNELIEEVITECHNEFFG
ncbi:MAG: C-GCAxxG-C-C family protein [Paramuribaculum sp.]|nr:C-GCAxxG-C-C family protein [Paramuribaculum sp.]